MSQRTDIPQFLGEQVSFIDLKTKHLNGKRGVVIKWNNERERFIVKLDSNGSLKSVKPKVIKHSSDINSTFMLDGEKELCEAIFFISFTSNKVVPSKYINIFSPSSLLKGMAEAASELRRAALDKIRENNVLESEKYLEIMNEVVDVLESVDYPEGVTTGLRRTTDQLRSVVERTRGDITIALERKELERSINSLKEELNN